MAKLKVDLDEANIAHEGTLAALRQKHNNSMAELGNQIDAINKNKVTDNFHSILICVLKKLYTF